MKVEKSERHSSILHFHRQDCFLNQGCWGMTQNTMKNTFARYQQSHELLLFFTSKNVSFFQVMFFFLENRQFKAEMNNSFFKVKLRLWKLNDFILEVKMTKLTSFFWLRIGFLFEPYSWWFWKSNQNFGARSKFLLNIFSFWKSLEFHLSLKKRINHFGLELTNFRHSKSSSLIRTSPGVFL